MINPYEGRCHMLKSWREPFEAVRSGKKTHEIRVNDRDYRRGDLLVLCCWDHERQIYAEDCWPVVCRVTHLDQGGNWGLPDGMVVMSVRVLR